MSIDLSRSTMAVRNPATAEVIDHVRTYEADDARAAVARSAGAQEAWSRRPPRHRAEVLRAAWKALLDRRDQLADLIVLENGKPRRDAEAEVDYAAEFFRWNSEEAVRVLGTVGVLPGGGRQLVLRQPIGVVLCVTPWNLPAAMLTRKIAPALAAGCAVVCKPAPATPLTALAVADCLAEAGVPDGLVQVLPAHDDESFVRAVLAEGAVRKLSFTGSTATGARLLRLAADRVQSCAMELGGNAPFLVLGDADIDVAVEAALVAKLRHNSQACTAANRFLVAPGRADEFVERLSDRFASLQVGPGCDPRTEVGPLIDARALAKVSTLVDAAVTAGATVRAGGSALEGPGCFYEPTVLAQVEPGNPILAQEIFGPVAPVVEVADDDDAMVAIANATDLGLAAYICTEDLARGLRLAERLEVGMVGINRGIVSDPAAPFGGVKSSGIGREGGHEGVLAFTEPKLVVTDWGS